MPLERTNDSFSMPGPGMRPATLLAACVFALPVCAAPNDALQLYAATGFGYDDNLLRLPEGGLSRGARSDRWWQREAGLLFDQRYSRQRISLVAKLSRYEFDRFKKPDYNGKDLQATLFWQLGSRLQGKAGLLQETVLAT